MGCVKKEERPLARVFWLISSKWRARVCVCLYYVCSRQVIAFITLINFWWVYRPCLRRSLNLFSLFLSPTFLYLPREKRTTRQITNKIGGRQLQTLHRVWTFDQNGNVCVYVCCCHDSLDGILSFFFYLLFSLKDEFGSCSHFEVLYNFFFKCLGCSEHLRSSLVDKTIWNISETAENNFWWDVPLIIR